MTGRRRWRPHVYFSWKRVEQDWCNALYRKKHNGSKKDCKYNHIGVWPLMQRLSGFSHVTGRILFSRCELLPLGFINQAISRFKICCTTLKLKSVTVQKPSFEKSIPSTLVANITGTYSLPISWDLTSSFCTYCKKPKQCFRSNTLAVKAMCAVVGCIHSIKQCAMHAPWVMSHEKSITF